ERRLADGSGLAERAAPRRQSITLFHLHAEKRALEGIDKLLWHDRGADRECLQLREVKFLDQVPMLKKQGEDSRHAASKCDLVASCGLKKAPRLEPRHDDRLGAGVKNGLDGAAHGVLVKQRNRNQPNFGIFDRPMPLSLTYAP